MDKKELTKQFESMEIQAKQFIAKGKSPLAYAEGVTNFAIEQINENKDIALWITVKARKVIKNLGECARECRSSKDE